MDRWRSSGARRQRIALTGLLAVAAAISGACEAGPAPATPPIVPGASAAPREVNLIAKDYEFLPATLDLVPGETVLLHVINGGLEVHEAIIGDAGVQDAWERAEAAVAGAPPGPTPVVSVAPEVSGLRIVVRSGERVDVIVDRPDRRFRRQPAGVHRRLPYPRPLGARDAGSRTLGRRVVSAAGGTLWTRADGVRISDVPTPLEEDAA